MYFRLEILDILAARRKLLEDWRGGGWEEASEEGRGRGRGKGGGDGSSWRTRLVVANLCKKGRRVALTVCVVRLRGDGVSLIGVAHGRRLRWVQAELVSIGDANDEHGDASDEHGDASDEHGDANESEARVCGKRKHE